MGDREAVLPVAAQAYRALERLVVTLALPPSSVTTEGALIERVGLGRTPVREAIQRLAWEGLLEVRPRAGVAVAPLNASDWLRVLAVRQGVEVVLARSAARFVTAGASEIFRLAGAAMHEAAAAGDVIAFLEADKGLDEALVAASDNPFAARLAAPLQSHSRRFWFRYQADAGLAQSAAHHLALVAAVLDGDEQAAGDQASRLIDMLRVNAEAAIRR